MLPRARAGRHETVSSQSIEKRFSFPAPRR